MFIEISGLLFLLIIVVLVLASSRYGYEIFSELDPEAQLQKINEDPKKFRTGTLLVVLEHFTIVVLAITLFIAFNSYNLILGVVWLISRGTEGLIQIYNKTKFLGLLNVAERYLGASSAEKDTLNDTALTILKSKNSTFAVAQILFSIGTLAYSILFAFYGVILVYIGWFGIVASIIYGIGNGIARMKPDSKALWNVGGFLIWIFELVLGGWLLLSSLLP
ncbi:MAG: DUF4386 family protein [Candidatus Thorarchaeota archaeon]